MPTLNATALVAAGVQLNVLLALSDEGVSSSEHAIAARLAAMGVPASACTLDVFADLMAVAIQKQDTSRWASGRDLTSPREQAEPMPD
ncbi:MAG: hypothetical protein KA354_04535 [Phycisphaerae bacterium]|nr:hypothetical protein [Phycisphaerae bacterium]